jgi:hypothetical protein
MRGSDDFVDSVRSRPCGGPPGCPRTRTYSGQRQCPERSPVAFPQVRCYVTAIGGVVCKASLLACVARTFTVTISGNSYLPAAGRVVITVYSVRLCGAESLVSVCTGQVTAPRERCAGPSDFPRAAAGRKARLPALAGVHVGRERQRRFRFGRVVRRPARGPFPSVTYQFWSSPAQSWSIPPSRLAGGSEDVSRHSHSSATSLLNT